MVLGEFLAGTKQQIFADLSSGAPPRTGQYDPAVYAELAKQGHVQIGPSVLSPEQVVFEFIFGPPGSPSVFAVTVEPPERIVFMPVPEWVIESVWQGEVDGSYHFESHAYALLEGFAEKLRPTVNAKCFEARMPTGRQ